MWRSPFSWETQPIILCDKKPKGNVKINDLEIAEPLAQIHIFAPKMQPLEHTNTAVDNTPAQGWSRRVSVRSATVVGTILQNLTLMTQSRQIYASISRIKWSDNTIADASSRMNHLPNRIFLSHFTLIFPQKKPWHMLPVPSKCRRRLNSMLHSKCCHVDFKPPYTRRNSPTGANGANSVDSCASQPTSKLLGNLSLSYRYLTSACKPLFW